MRMVDLLEKKRDGHALTKEEIDFIIEQYTNDLIPDYQMSALAMAIFFQGMNEEETAALTDAMVRSGDVIDLSAIEGTKVDKHSTGGVGDTVTLPLAALVASLGVPVPKMSGRGLGHTGGTVDKLESIPGFQVEITSEKFIDLVNKNKVAVIGQTENLTPADKKLYGLRDVTATVNSIPLIASSIMSKKIASGADAIVLDVKTGSGAFMKELDDARALAKTMVKIGNNLGRKTTAIISDMSEPLGNAVGNALEVMEAIDVLKGKGPEDLTELCLELGCHMVMLGGKAETLEEGRKMLEDALHSGKALQTFRTFIKAQGGDDSFVDDFDKLPQAQFQIPVIVDHDGFVSGIDANKIGTAAMLLGAGRATKEAKIDLAVGIVLMKKVGDEVKSGDTVAVIHSNKENVGHVLNMIKESYHFSKSAVSNKTLIHEVIQ